jgi:hypothetical protein
MKRIIIKNKKEPRKQKEINPLEGWNVLVCVCVYNISQVLSSSP